MKCECLTQIIYDKKTQIINKLKLKSCEFLCSILIGSEFKWYHHLLFRYPINRLSVADNSFYISCYFSCTNKVNERDYGWIAFFVLSNKWSTCNLLTKLVAPLYIITGRLVLSFVLNIRVSRVVCFGHKYTILINFICSPNLYVNFFKFPCWLPM